MYSMFFSLLVAPIPNCFDKMIYRIALIGSMVISRIIQLEAGMFRIALYDFISLQTSFLLS